MFMTIEMFLYLHCIRAELCGPKSILITADTDVHSLCVHSLFSSPQLQMCTACGPQSILITTVTDLHRLLGYFTDDREITTVKYHRKSLAAL